MTAWRIVALAPADDAGAWREAGDAASAIAGASGESFDLLVIGPAAPAGDGWNNLSRCTLLQTRERPVQPAQYASLAAPILAEHTTPTLVLVPPGPAGEEIGAELAVRLGGAMLGRVTGVALSDEMVRVTRLAFGGRASVSLSYPLGLVFASMRAAAAVEHAVLPAPTIVDVATPSVALAIERAAAPGRKAPLEGARLVVSGGRGLDQDGFAMLEEIADALGGAVGASLPAVDAGLAPVSRQVGQSGKFVSPLLYFAAGLSGTPQHLAGIGSATKLVALNSDASAPIFSYAELGAVADAKSVLPLLRDMLVARAARGAS